MRPEVCTTLCQVAKLPFHVLEARFGERAAWIADAVRGISDDPVQVPATATATVCCHGAVLSVQTVDSVRDLGGHSQAARFFAWFTLSSSQPHNQLRILFFFRRRSCRRACWRPSPSRRPPTGVRCSAG